jgi:hypothetical protein
MMSIWRVIELARSCVWALARHDNVCAALLARAALESSAQFVDAARTINATVNLGGCILDPTKDLNTAPIAWKPLEEYLVKTVFASRLPDAEEIYKAPNITGPIKRISKSAGQEFVLPTYDLLCEITHPNFLGRAIYLLEAAPGSRPGNEVRTIGLGEGPTSVQFKEPLVAALSWACGTQVTAFDLMSQTIHAVLAVLDLGKIRQRSCKGGEDCIAIEEPAMFIVSKYPGPRSSTRTSPRRQLIDAADRDRCQFRKSARTLFISICLPRRACRP